MKKFTYLSIICIFILGISLVLGSQIAHADPGISPTLVVSSIPTPVSTSAPTELPAPLPTEIPTTVPTALPTDLPTPSPTTVPTVACSPLPTNTGAVTTTITLEDTAKYAVWSRIMTPDNTNASYYLVIDNQCGIKVGGNSINPNIWFWINYSEGSPSNRIVVDLTKGSHLIKMIGDTTNLKLDKIIFTPDMSCVPTGLGTNCNQIATPTLASSATPTQTAVSSGPTALLTATSQTPNPLVTDTLIPTETPAPTPTPIPGTQFSVTVLIHGVGHGGDNVAPNSNGNTMPIHIQRTAAVEIYNSNNTLVASPTGVVTFDPHTGAYKGIVDVGRVLPAGPYITKIVIAHHFYKSAVKIVTITSGEANPITLDAVQEVAGDLNGDGKLDIHDFNIILNCVSDLGPAKKCTSDGKQAADLNDDGVVDLTDLNLYFREVAVQSGQ